MDNKGFLDPLSEDELKQLEAMESGEVSEVQPEVDEPTEEVTQEAQLEQPKPDQPDAATSEEPVKTDPANSPDRPEGYVPAQALKETRGELKEMKERFNRFLEAMATRSQQPDAKPEPPEVEDPEPDKATDPLGHSEWNVRQLQKTVDELKGNLDGVQAQTTHDRQFQAYTQELERDAASIPDFKDASAHLQQLYTQQLQNQGVPENQIPFYMRQKEVEIANSAYAMGVKPANMFYYIAQQNGYQKAEAQPDPAGNPAPPPAQPPVDLKAKVEQRQAAANANQSLSQLSGNTADLSSELTREQFVAMSEADIHKMIAKLGPDEAAQIMSEFA